MKGWEIMLQIITVKSFKAVEKLLNDPNFMVKSIHMLPVKKTIIEKQTSPKITEELIDHDIHVICEVKDAIN